MEEENPRELARLLKEIDDGLSELTGEFREILEEVESVISTKFDQQTGAHSHHDNVVTLTAAKHVEIACHHEVGFYSNDRLLLDDLTLFVGAALKAGSSAIVIARESHRDSLLPRLQGHGLDMGKAIEEGRYIALDAADALSTFMVNDMPDPVRFTTVFGNLIQAGAKAAKVGHPRVAIFGECVHFLWAEGNAEASIQVEKLANRLNKTYDVNILCGYSFGSVEVGMDNHIFQRICAEHSAVHSR